MAKVALIARFTAKEGRAEELLAAFGPVFEHVAGEPGTLVYTLHHSRQDPHLIWVYELYQDDDAVAAHGAYMATVLPGLEDLIAEWEIITGEPVLAKGIPT